MDPAGRAPCREGLSFRLEPSPTRALKHLPRVDRRVERGGELPSLGPACPSAARARGARYALFQADAVDWLRELPSASADLILTDPPYESLEKHRAVGTTTRLSHSNSSSNDWFRIFPNARFPELLAELFRVLKPNSHAYIFSDQETLFVLKPLSEAAGFRFWKPLVWDKQRLGMGYHYRARYEFVLFLEKGKRKLTSLSVPDVLSFPRVQKGYPTEKPVGLAKVFIEQSSQAGELVVDPFMGSASVGEAALASGRLFWGNDISEASIGASRQRLLPFGS
jgi:site-specific DNA-methyltransferase (adenine-specific)